MIPHRPESPIGIFDSGVGGLSVLRSIREVLPGEPILFIADQAHVPYGPRPLEEVRLYSEGITRYLLQAGSKLIVVACNAASAASLTYLRKTFPNISFVGMEPAVKPAAEHSESRVVAVLATPATFQGALYSSVVERFGNGVTLLQHTCPGLVAQIESGDLDSQETRGILEQALKPMIAKGADTVVLGCTHYPFVIPLIREIAGIEVRVIDPAPAVARQVHNVLEQNSLLVEDLIVRSEDQRIQTAIIYNTTGNPREFKSLLNRLLQLDAPVAQLIWQGSGLVSG